MLVFEGMKQVFDGGEIVAGAEVPPSRSWIPAQQARAYLPTT